jgi:hypothetical protein
MVSYREIRNKLLGIPTTIANRAHPAVPSRGPVEHPDEEGNDIVQEEAVGQAA